MGKGIREVTRWELRQLKPFRWQITSVVLLGILRVCFGLGFVWVSRTLIDVAVGEDSDVHRIVVLSCVLAALLVMEVVLRLVGQYIAGKAEIMMKNAVRERLFNWLLESRWIKRQRVHSGEWVSRLTEDVRVLSDAAVQRLPQLLIMGVQFAGAFAFLCFLSWHLALIVVGITPLFLVLSKLYVRRTRRLTGEIRSGESEMQVIMQEGIVHQMVLQTLGAIPGLSKGFDATQEGVMRSTMARQRFNITSRALLNAGFVGCFLTAFLWSVWHLHTHAITFGTMTAFLQLVSRLQNPVVNMASQLPAIVQSVSSAERLMEIEGLEREKMSRQTMLKAPVGIRLKDVDFRYPGGSRMILDGFTHDFAPGSKTAVMGPTGVGKSTLTRLILGLLAPDSGEIELYGAGGETVTAGVATRGNFSYVPQGNSLLKGTVRENLLVGNPEATEEEMHEALRIADAEFALALPEGLDTECGEGATSLSEGQAQRIAIARALLRNRSVLILDEFNSSLDADTAERILQRLMECRRDVTMIFISHRPEILRYCSLLKMHRVPRLK